MKPQFWSEGVEETSNNIKPQQMEKSVSLKSHEAKELKTFELPSSLKQALDEFVTDFLRSKFSDKHLSLLWLVAEVAIAKAVQAKIVESLESVPEDERGDFVEGMSLLHLVTTPLEADDIETVTNGKATKEEFLGLTSSAIMSGDSTASSLALANFLAEHPEFELKLNRTRKRVRTGTDIDAKTRIMGLTEEKDEDTKEEIESVLEELAKALAKMETIEKEAKQASNFSDS